MLRTVVVCTQVGKSVLVRITYDFFNDVAAGDCFRKYSVGNPIKMPPWAAAIVRTIAGDVAVSDSVSTPCGIVNAGDTVWLRDPCRLATVKLAVRVDGQHNDHRFAAIVECFARASSGAWTDRTDAPIVVDAGSIATACCAMILDGHVYV